MRQGHNPKRSRGNRKNNSHNRTIDSTGPEVKIRGSATQLVDKYQNLAREANVSGDRVASENYLQHAEHYFRVAASQGGANPPRQDSVGGHRQDSVGGHRRNGGHNRDYGQPRDAAAIAQPAQTGAAAEAEVEKTVSGGTPEVSPEADGGVPAGAEAAEKAADPERGTRRRVTAKAATGEGGESAAGDGPKRRRPRRKAEGSDDAEGKEPVQSESEPVTA